MRHLLSWLLLGAWLALPGAAPAQAPARVPKVRYLFVIDNSSGMARLAQNTQATVFEMIATGFYGQARAGEIFGVWTFNDTVDQRALPLQTWLPELQTGLAVRTAKFVQGLPYRRAARLDRAVADLRDAIKLCDSLVVFLISDGADVVVGTPFDRPINISYGHRFEELRAAKRPFVTTFVSHHGEIVDWSVTAGGERIVIPLGPIAAQLAATDFLAAARTLPAAPAAGTAGFTAEISTVPAPPVPLVALALGVAPAAATHPSSTGDGAGFSPAPLKLEPAPPPEFIVPDSSPARVPATAALAPAPAHATGDDKVIAAVIAPAAGVAEVTSAPPEPLPAPVLVPQTAVVTPSVPVGKWPWLAGGAALLVIAAFLILPQLRRAAAPPETSLISRALERKGK